MRVKGIARYPHVINPSAPKGSDKQRFSLSILVHKSDPQCAAIHNEIEQVKQNGFPAGFPANGHVCWKDLAVEEPNNPAVHDYMSLSANTLATNGRPTLVDHTLQDVIDPGVEGRMEGTVVYADVGVASFNQVSQGVKAYLNGVMVTQEAGAIPKEALSSKPDANSMFGDITGGAPAPAFNAPTPAQPAAPAFNAPAPAAPVPPTAPAPEPQYVMTATAQGVTREAYHQAGWTDAQLVENGLMQPPAGVTPSWG